MGRIYRWLSCIFISNGFYNPQKKIVPEISDTTIPSDISESEVLTSILRGHDSMVAVMTSRSKNLQIVRALWTGGNIRVGPHFTWLLFML